MSDGLPTRKDLIQAVRDARASIDGTDKAVLAQAMALLRYKGLRPTRPDIAKLTRFVEEG